jgi:hypothetical protein
MNIPADAIPLTNDPDNTIYSFTRKLGSNNSLFFPMGSLPADTTILRVDVFTEEKGANVTFVVKRTKAT